MKKEELHKIIPIFPLTNFIIFPKSTVPLNIFEPRYIQMIDESMKGRRLIGITQPKKTGQLNKPDLYNVGCVGKITSFNETEDGRYLIVLNGICRFTIISEITNDKLYRECEVNYNDYINDLSDRSQNLDFSNLNLIFNKIKELFKKQGYIINWKDIKKQSLNEVINTLSMASPFSVEEKQILLECKNIKSRREKLEEIIKTYSTDNFNNTTLQ